MKGVQRIQSGGRSRDPSPDELCSVTGQLGWLSEESFVMNPQHLEVDTSLRDGSTKFRSRAFAMDPRS